MNTVREVYWKSSDKLDKSTSIEMYNNHEYSIMQIFWISIIPKLLTQLFTATHTHTHTRTHTHTHTHVYIVYGNIQKFTIISIMKTYLS